MVLQVALGEEVLLVWFVYMLFEPQHRKHCDIMWGGTLGKKAVLMTRHFNYHPSLGR